MVHAPPPKDLDVATMKMAEHKHFHVMYEIPGGMAKINKIHSWKLMVKDTDGKPVGDANITVVGDMPEHGHGLPTRPEIFKGSTAGMYHVDGMKFNMPGWWVVTFNVKAQGMQDSVSFNLKVH
jgi:hypothetical protein